MKWSKNKSDKYLKVRKERQEYLGIRYFRYNYEAEKVVQVCLGVGELMKRGKSHNVGVYLIHKMTLFSNYMAMNYVEPCTKKEFDYNFKKAIKTLL